MHPYNKELMKKQGAWSLLASLLLLFNVNATPQEKWQLVPPSEVPEVATFWILSWTENPPLPFNPCPGCNVYSIGDGQFVVDDSELSVAQGAFAQTLQDPTPPDFGEDGTNGVWNGFEFTSQVYGSNELYLSISNANGIASVVLHNIQQGRIYALDSTTSLVERDWKTEQSLHTTTAQSFLETRIPVSLQTESLFLRARDWTDEDTNTNSIPDWWEWENFGSLQSADDDFDDDGSSNLTEYTQGTDPNTIAFTVTCDALKVNSNAVVRFSVSAGEPSYIGVLVDSTNFAAADWYPYSSSLAIDLGNTDNTKNIWFSLKGREGASQPNHWEEFQFTRDTTPPLIFVTNPTTSTVTRPIVQFEGFSPERLSRLRYNLINDAGSVTNQPGYVTRQWTDANTFEFTTNWFKCLDIELTNGVNTLVLFATDMAGNISSNSFTYTLDYSLVTNPPAMSLHWPQDGAEISGSSFTCRGRVDDPTATLSALVVNGTNSFSDLILVERDGKFWAENLPLLVGTNMVTLTATNAAGLGSVTNITVVRSDLVLTMDSLAGDPALWNASVTVHGSVSDSTYAVWVNGVKATVDPDGRWTATNVPVNDGGTASFDVTAYAPDEQQPDSPHSP